MLSTNSFTIKNCSLEIENNYIELTVANVSLNCDGVCRVEGNHIKSTGGLTTARICGVELTHFMNNLLDNITATSPFTIAASVDKGKSFIILSEYESSPLTYHKVSKITG